MTTTSDRLRQCHRLPSSIVLNVPAKRETLKEAWVLAAQRDAVQLELDAKLRQARSEGASFADCAEIEGVTGETMRRRFNAWDAAALAAEQGGE